jgi:hypothetical protein
MGMFGGKYAIATIVVALALGGALVGCRSEETFSPSTVVSPSPSVPVMQPGTPVVTDAGGGDVIAQLHQSLLQQGTFISGTLQILRGDAPDTSDCSKPCTIPTDPVLNWQNVGRGCMKIDTYSALADDADVYAALYQATVNACERSQQFIPKVTPETTNAQNHEWAQEALGDLPAAVEAAKAGG